MRRQALEDELRAERLRHQAAAMTNVQAAWAEHITTYDEADLQRAAATAAHGLLTHAKKASWQGAPQHRYGPLRLRQVDGGRTHVTMEIIDGYRTVTELTVKRKALRTGGGPHLAQLLTDWVEGIEGEASRLTGHARTLVAQARATVEAADQIAFSKAGELEAAVRTLEQINAEINAEVSEEAPAAA